jgi:hypothetical protein
MTEPTLGLSDGLRLSGLTHEQLWHRYLILGGGRTLGELREHLDSAACPDEHDHNVLAQALNEVFLERGKAHRVGYRNLFRLATERQGLADGR